MDRRITLGSLFDGIGGFPLCAELSGVTPVWAAEIDPACIAVTKQHFPDMLHLGNISQINGAEIPPVDIITFGSPCQDLSVAGKQAGLDGERSGLFFEAIRIIYEMRLATNGKYPTFIVWENVPGAFTGHNGNDFRTVLEEITKTDIPMPASGRWATSGVVRSERICAAWRQLDAQYWGVPQRRKRIYLVGSFGSNCAEEILFKRDSVRRYLAPRGTARKGFAADTEGSVVVGSGCFDVRGSGGDRTVPTMTGDHNSRVTDYSAVVLQAAGFLDRAPKDAYSIGYEKEKSPTLRAGMIPSVIAAAGFNGQNSITAGDVEMREELSPTIICKKQVDVLYAAGFKGGAGAKAGGVGFEEEKSLALMSTPSGTNATPTVIVQAKGFPLGFKPDNTRLYDEPATTLCNGTRPGHCNVVVYAIGNGQADNTGLHEKVGALNCMHDQQAVLYTLDCASFNQGANALYDFDINDGDINSTIVAKEPSAVAYKFIEWIIRRLTPLECERLQGYPDYWTVIRKIENMTDTEYEFFLDTFLLDKAIRGKKVKKTPNKQQLLNWYNKLDCDGTRYRQLGNSLAIPCALRVIGYIADYIRKREDTNVEH